MGAYFRYYDTDDAFDRLIGYPTAPETDYPAEHDVEAAAVAQPESTPQEIAVWQTMARLQRFTTRTLKNALMVFGSEEIKLALKTAEGRGAVARTNKRRGSYVVYEWLL